MLTSLVVAASLASLAPEACSGRDDSVATFSVASPDSALLEVFTTETPALACMRMGACTWGWTPTPAELAEIDAISRSISGSGDSDCSVHSIRSGDGATTYEGQRIAECEEQASNMQGLMFGRQFVEALSLDACDPVSVDDGGVGEVRAIANVATAGERFCLAMFWDPSASTALVSIGTVCDSAPPSTGFAVTAVTRDGTRSASWHFDPAPEGWIFSSANGDPMYARTWAQSVGRALNDDLRMPPKDPLGYQAQADAVLPFLLSRWALAFAARDGTSFDTTMREWMGRVTLMNPTTAVGTLYRSECASDQTPRIESCAP